MAVREPASLPEDAAARQRMRAEAPPPHYWRRWTGDAATMPAAATPAADPTPHTGRRPFRGR